MEQFDKEVQNDVNTVPTLELKQVFRSDEELEEALNSYSKFHRLVFVTGKSYTYKQLNSKKIKNPSIKFHSLTKICKFGEQRPSEATGEREGKTFKRDCPAFFHFKGSEGKFYILDQLHLEHTNHEGFEKYYEHIPEKRKLTEEEKKEVRFLRSLNCQTSLLHQHMLNKTGKQINTQDLYNAVNETKIKNGNDLESAVEHLKNKHGASVEILEEESEFLGMYFSTPQMRHHMNLFPEVVCVDCTYKVFDLKFSLMIFVIEDNEGRTQFVGLAILVSETRQIVKWAMECFKKDHSEAVKRISGFITDKDMTERSVIAEVFPWVKLFICQFHVLRIFGREICLTKMPINKEQKENALRLLEKMVKSSCQEDYDEAHQKFMDTAPAVIKNYFAKNWASITDEWVKFKIFKLNLKNLTNNRLESLNGKLKNEIGTYNSLIVFIDKLFNWIGYRLKCMSLKSIQLILKINRQDMNQTDFTRAQSLYKQYLTDYAYRKVSEEFTYFEYLTLHNLDEVSQTCTGRCRKEDIYITPYSCTCFEMFSMGLPCRHMLAIRLALKMPLFSKDICLPRWTKGSDECHDFNSSNSRLSTSYSTPTKFTSKKTTKTNSSKTKTSSSDNKNESSVKGQRRSATTPITSLKTPSHLSIGIKREKIKPTMDELVDAIVEQPDETFFARSSVAKTLLKYWKDNKDVRIIVKDENPANNQVPMSEMQDSMEQLSLQKSDLTLADIAMPTPIKRTGRVRGINSCTTKQSKK